MSRLIVITSGKGGVGKTTSAINIGSSLNSFGKEVIIVDANLTTPNIGLHLGSPVVPISLNDVLTGKNKPIEAIYEHHSGTKIMPSSLSLDSLKGIKQENLAKVIKKVKRLADVVICDSPAGLGKDVESIISMADELVIITNPELPAVTDALKTIKLAEDLGRSVTGIVIARSKNGRKELSKKDIQNMLERPILGTVPEDIAIKEALLLKDSVIHTHPKSNAAIAYKKLSARLIGRRYSPIEEETSFFGRILRGIGLKR